MRMMLKVIIPADKGTDAIKDGSMQQALQDVVDHLHPEAAYFCPQDGQRAMFLFFEMNEVSDLVPVVEPFWMNLDADVELTPAMNLEDLKKGLGKLQL